ncbi:MAG: glutamate--tRNA ligase family protein [Candidatus Micrarchaeota archaeon]
MDLAAVVRKHTLKNAYDYGKADPKGVVGKVVAELPEAKKDMKSTMSAVSEEVARVNALDKAEIGKELAGYSFEEKKEGPREYRLPQAEQGKVVTRFLPEPNGYPHLGHAKAAFLSAEVARFHGGTCLLRFDDTNPEAERQEYVDAIKEGLQWLGLGFAGELYASDRMPQLQQFGQKLLILGRAYACTCPKEAVNANRFKGTACNCRERRGGENLALWNKMASGGIGKGEGIIRLKADMKSANTVMRDPTLFRVIEAPHYRQGDKYRVWPTYDFEVSIADSLDGVTHALRSKEYELRDELYYAILDAVSLPKPLVYDFSRLSIAGTALSKRILRPLVESGKVPGWDDPRLPTLAGLRRRGILPQAAKEFVLRQGLGKQENAPPFSDLLQINRSLLDPVAPHHFFVEDPVKLAVGGRTFHVPRHDADSLKGGDEFRLKDLMTVRIESKSEGLLACSESAAEPKGMRKIQWVEEGKAVAAKAVFFSDLLDSEGNFNPASMRVADGFAQKECADLEQGAFVQFERVGFFRLDDKAKMSFFSCG